MDEDSLTNLKASRRPQTRPHLEGLERQLRPFVYFVFAAIVGDLNREGQFLT